MPTNNRVYFPNQGVAIKTNGGALTFSAAHRAFGVQTLAMGGTINLAQIFTLGNIALYENAEILPEVEVSLDKVLDGYCPAYLLATTAATAPTLVGRSAARCDLGVAIYPDTNDFASGTPVSVCVSSGLYVNSVSFSFQSDGTPFTESVSWVGNDRIWTRGGTTPNYGETDMVSMPTITWNADFPSTLSPSATAGVSLSQEFLWDLPTGTGAGPLTLDDNGAVNYADVSVMPQEIQGIGVSGINPQNSGKYDANIQSVTVGTSLNRESLNQLGKKGPYFRSVQFPVEVTTEITSITAEGDLITLLEAGAFGTGVGSCSSDRTNVKDRTIRVVTCDGLRLYTGRKNKLASVNYAGGDAGGGNVTVTYNYSTFNELTVLHINDVHASGSAWWAARNSNGFVVQ